MYGQADHRHEGADVILDQVIHVVADVLGVSKAAIGIETHGNDVEAWDSFGHVRIVLALEAQFAIHLTMAEIETSGSIRGLVEAVESALERSERQ